MSSMMNSSLKGLHDRLLAEKPDGATHDRDSCPLCAMTEGALDAGRGQVSERTYTEAELTAAVEQAAAEKTAALEAQVRDLQTAALTTEVSVAVAAAKAEADVVIADLQRQLDEKVLEAATASAEREAITAWLDAEKAAAVEAERIGTVKVERLAKVREVASFPEEYLTANVDRFAAMSDDAFQVALDGWAAIAKGVSTGGIPKVTSLHASQEMDRSPSTSSAVKDMFALRREHGRTDFSTL